MNKVYQLQIMLTVTLLVLFAGCASKGDILSQMSEEDIEANKSIVTKMKSRTYNVGLKSASNSISEVLSNISKSARLLENEIGHIISIETGFPVHHNNHKAIKHDQVDEGDTFSNTFKYTSNNDILWVNIRASQLGTGSTNINMTFLRTALGSRGKLTIPLPPKYTQSIYDKLWLAMEKELK
ncbi:MAG: hypothetical protein ACQ9MH_13645 [Nitrospinales bacterium]